MVDEEKIEVPRQKSEEKTPLSSAFETELAEEEDLDETSFH
jgi:hypothetical protein